MIKSREARQRAHAILNMFGIKIPPIDVFDVAKKLGFEVIPYDFPEQTSGVMMIEDGIQAIGVNENHALVRQRFSVAHELGHYLFGHDDFAGGNKTFVDGSYNYADPQNRQELEANEFAAELLMPENMLRNDFSRFGLNVDKLSELYQVSKQAMWIQLINLRLAEEARRQVK